MLRAAAALAFVLAATADLTALALHGEWRIATKPPLMVLLALFVALAPAGLRAMQRWVIGALIASSAGDALLLGSSDAAFVAGTLCFALAHVGYIAAFAVPPGRGLVRRRPWWIAPYALAWLAATLVLAPHLGVLAAVVVPYGALATAMALAALNLFGRVPPLAAGLAAGGALLFVSSDTNLALGRFVPALAPPHVDLLVMATYLLAQAGIVAGTTLAARLPQA